eukprot:scaffold7020_cov430-Prasinococcus_capsulatus_cf.AAC.1
MAARTPTTPADACPAAPRFGSAERDGAGGRPTRFKRVATSPRPQVWAFAPFPVEASLCCFHADDHHHHHHHHHRHPQIARGQGEAAADGGACQIGAGLERIDLPCPSRRRQRRPPPPPPPLGADPGLARPRCCVPKVSARHIPVPVREPASSLRPGTRPSLGWRWARGQEAQAAPAAVSARAEWGGRHALSTDAGYVPVGCYLKERPLNPSAVPCASEHG